MIFTGVAIGATGFLYLLNRYCFNHQSRVSENGTNESESDACCFGCLRASPDNFSEDETIPLSVPGADNQWYSSISTFPVAIGIQKSETSSTLNTVTLSDGDDLKLTGSSNSNHYTTRSNSPTSLNPVKVEVYDFHRPLNVNSSKDSVSHSTSPPDLLSMQGKQAVEAYSDFIKITGKSAQGPNIVNGHVIVDEEYHVPKSKSSITSIFKDEKSYGKEIEDDYDAQYHQRKEKFLRDNNLGGIERSSSLNSEKKVVSFNGVTRVRVLSIESDK